MQVHILYGTETGAAELLCEDLKDGIQETVDAKISSLEDLTPSDLNEAEFYVFVISTFGSGDVPFTAQEFHSTLLEQQPDLSSIRFAIFGLGDMKFSSTFNRGSEQVMEDLLKCKAQMVGERSVFDASSADMPEDIALPWLKQILKQAMAVA